MAKLDVVTFGPTGVIAERPVAIELHKAGDGLEALDRHGEGMDTDDTGVELVSLRMVLEPSPCQRVPRGLGTGRIFVVLVVALRLVDASDVVRWFVALDAASLNSKPELWSVLPTGR